MKFILGLTCFLLSSVILAGHMPGFIQVDNYYVYRSVDNNSLKAFKVLIIDKDWMYVQHFRKKDSYTQQFWISINNKNIKYITNCKDKHLHESEKNLCNQIS